MNIYTIIPSGGSGKRANTETPKQYMKFNGKELIAYTLEVFQNCELIDQIIIAAQPDYFNLINNIKMKYNFSKISNIVPGGNERQDSVFNALSSISAEDDDLIAVHDAARPLLPSRVLINAINSGKEHGSVVVAIKAKDTIIKGSEKIIDYIKRDNLYYVQTPQVFKYSILKKSMLKAKKDGFYGTDESMLVKKASYNVEIVEGDPVNFKITTESDLQLFSKLIN